jgi:hypothetical protein
MEKLYSTFDVAIITNIGYKNLMRFIKILADEGRVSKTNGIYCFTKAQVIDLCNTIRSRFNTAMTVPDFSLIGEDNDIADIDHVTNADTDNTNIIANSKTVSSAPAFSNSNSFSLDTLIAKAEQDETPLGNYYKSQREKFEALTPKDFKIMFRPLVERFKFSYIAEITKVQTQTLTCIKQGNLKGLETYQLTFAAFLKLLKFCGENNCPVEYTEEYTDTTDTTEEVNS